MTTGSATDWRVRWRVFFSEVIGTAALVWGGLSVVIVMFGDGSPIGRIVPNEQLRMALTGFLFGCIGERSRCRGSGRRAGPTSTRRLRWGSGWYANSTRARRSAMSSRSWSVRRLVRFHSLRGD